MPSRWICPPCHCCSFVSQKFQYQFKKSQSNLLFTNEVNRFIQKKTLHGAITLSWLESFLLKIAHENLNSTCRICDPWKSMVNPRRRSSNLVCSCLSSLREGNIDIILSRKLLWLIELEVKNLDVFCDLWWFYFFIPEKTLFSSPSLGIKRLQTHREMLIPQLWTD